MKEFIVYTGLRILLFLATWGILSGAWVLIAGQAALGVTCLIAFVLSGVGSFFLLRGPREAFAQRVEVRADRAVSRFDEMRAREDVD